MTVNDATPDALLVAGLVVVPPFVGIESATEAPGTKLESASRAVASRIVELTPLAVRLAELPDRTAKETEATAPGVIVKASVVALMRVPELAMSVYPIPALLRLKFEKTASPATAGALNTPLSVLDPGLAPSAIVIVGVAVVTGLPRAS